MDYNVEQMGVEVKGAVEELKTATQFVFPPLSLASSLILHGVAIKNAQGSVKSSSYSSS